MLAIYHSHPEGPQMPSSSDVAQAFYPDAAHVIVSLADRRHPVARAFMIMKGRVHEIVLNIV
jgi:proteasome lid subunit RPN8/RPN11